MHISAPESFEAALSIMISSKGKEDGSLDKRENSEKDLREKTMAVKCEGRREGFVRMWGVCIPVSERPGLVLLWGQENLGYEWSRALWWKE